MGLVNICLQETGHRPFHLEIKLKIGLGKKKKSNVIALNVPKTSKKESFAINLGSGILL